MEDINDVLRRELLGKPSSIFRRPPVLDPLSETNHDAHFSALMAAATAIIEAARSQFTGLMLADISDEERVPRLVDLHRGFRDAIAPFAYAVMIYLGRIDQEAGTDETGQLQRTINSALVTDWADYEAAWLEASEKIMGQYAGDPPRGFATLTVLSEDSYSMRWIWSKTGWRPPPASVYVGDTRRRSW